MTRLVVFAWGNPSRGDDALGPAFLGEAAALAHGVDVDVSFVTDFQLQPEHAVDLAARTLALFVDASTRGAAPFAFEAVTAAHDRTFTSHAMSPAAVLAAYADAFRSEPPPAFQLAIRGHDFELGAPIGAAAAAHLRAAVAFYRDLLRDASAAAWHDVAKQRAGVLAGS